MKRRYFLGFALQVFALHGLVACHSPQPASPPPVATPILPPVAVTPPLPTTPKLAPKPKIGVALGGGAAKGYAHIGIIKALEAAGFAPDVVAGTSAGSVVGAMYAAGLSGFDLQEKSFVLDETQIRDLTFGGDG